MSSLPLPPKDSFSGNFRFLSSLSPDPLSGSADDTQSSVQSENNHIAHPIPFRLGNRSFDETSSTYSAEDLLAGNQQVARGQQQVPALTGLKDQLVYKSQTKSVVAAAIGTAGGLLATGALVAAGKGALIGAAVGSVIPGIGTVVGAVVGGVLGSLVLGGATLYAGLKFGKHKAAQITPHSLKVKYQPGSDEFNRLTINRPVRGINLPSQISRDDRQRIRRSFSALLDARIACRQPVTRAFLESTVVALTYTFTACGFTEDDKQAISTHITAMLQARATISLPITVVLIDLMVDNVGACRYPENVSHLEPQDLERVKDGLKDVVEAERDPHFSMKNAVS